MEDDEVEDEEEDDDDEDKQRPAGSVDDVGHPQLPHIGNCLHLDVKNLIQCVTNIQCNVKKIVSLKVCSSTVLPLARISPGST